MNSQKCVFCENCTLKLHDKDEFYFCIQYDTEIPSDFVKKENSCKKYEDADIPF